MTDYFEMMRRNAERTWGQSNMVRPSFGTIGHISQAQAIGSIIPTETTWYDNPVLKPSPPVHEVKIQQVFFEPMKKQEGCVILSQEVILPPPQVDADGDVVMIDAQDIMPE